MFSKHVFDIANVDRIFDQFSLDEGLGRQYTVVIVGVNDMSLANPDGLRFKQGAGDAHSLDWWQEETQRETKPSSRWARSVLVQTFLMRIPVFEPELTNDAPIGTQKRNDIESEGEPYLFP